MGTRADFYVGRGLEAEWLGSIAWDGHPEGINKPLLSATTEEDYRNRVAIQIQETKSGTTPDMGWPWPWRDSRITDYAYAFHEGKVWASCFGDPWFDPMEEEEENNQGDKPVFPDMTKIQNVTFGERSGIVIARLSPKPQE